MEKGKLFWKSLNNISTLTKIIFDKRESRINKVQHKNNDLDIFSTNASKDEWVEYFRKIIKTKSLHIIFDEMIEDMFKFDFLNTSSVESSIMKANFTKNDLDRLEAVNLHHHSLGVVKQTLLTVEDSYGLLKDYFILAALVHDFGKSPELRSFYYLDANELHHKNSAKYLEFLINNKFRGEQEEIKLLNILKFTINAHHDIVVAVNNLNNDTSSDEALKELFMKFLKLADSNQRIIELK